MGNKNDVVDNIPPMDISEIHPQNKMKTALIITEAGEVMQMNLQAALIMDKDGNLQSFGDWNKMCEFMCSTLVEETSDDIKYYPSNIAAAPFKKEF